MNTIKLDDIFQAGMVLQRDRDFVIYGTAAPGSIVRIQIGDSEYEAYSSERGDFACKIGALSASRDLSLRVKDGSSSLEIYPLHVGDVYLAGGQSNMEFFLKFDEDFDRIKAEAPNPDIHMYNVPQVAFEGHTSRSRYGYGQWMKAGDNGFETFSAPAYSFARFLQPEIGVPIGLIGCNWGGSTASAWVPEEVLEKEPLNNYFKEYKEAMPDISEEELRNQSLEAWAFEDSAAHGRDFEPLLYGRSRSFQLDYLKEHAGEPVIPMGPYNMNRPCGLYHTMLKPLTKYPIKGVLWYQGESDAGNRAWMYDQLLTGLIRHWRCEWGYDFPFIMVQLAPFGKWLECGNEEYTVVRQMQQKVADELDDTYMVSIMDLGSYYDIHPKTKMEVGRRMSLIARKYIYGESGLLADAPRFIKGHLEGDRIVLQFDNADGLQIVSEKNDIVVMSTEPIPILDIECKDDNLILTIDTSVLTVSNTPSLTVSVGWADYAEIYIRNSSGLCMAPFKAEIQLTDNS